MINDTLQKIEEKFNKMTVTSNFLGASFDACDSALVHPVPLY